MKTKGLTVKQENFCQAYIRSGDKSAAYREAYSTSKMKPESVNRKAFELFNEVKIRSRVEVLQKEVAIRNEITIDELVQTLAGMVRFDPASVYDENGVLKSIHEMPIVARQMISELNIDEIKEYRDGKTNVIGQTKKLKLFDKLGAVEKLMRHLGGYEKDNKQKGEISISSPEEREARIEALIEKFKSSK
jgi:phage terminase small subunit